MSEENKYEGWMADNILKQFGIEKEHVEKAKDILDMLEMKEDEIVINVGPNIEIKIKK